MFNSPRQMRINAMNEQAKIERIKGNLGMCVLLMCWIAVSLV